MGNSVMYRPAYDAEVEYLESTGTQYIDTGVIPNFNYDIKIEVGAVLLTDGRSIICGNYITNDAGNFIYEDNINIEFGGNTSSKKVRIYTRFTTSSTLIDKYFSERNIYQLCNISFDYNSEAGTLTMSDGFDTDTVIRSNEHVSDNYNSLRLFSDYRVFQSSGYNCIRINYCKLTIGNTLLRDFIPVRIGQVGYMYDKVTKQLFANKGTGQFILGNDVSNAVIPQQRCVLYFGNQRSVIYERIYEEYEWLVGDGTAYINTNIIYLDGVIDIVAMVEGQYGKVLGRERLNTSSDYYSRFVISINPSNGLTSVFSSDQVSAYITQPLVLQIDIQNDSLTINGQSKSLDFIPNTEANSIYLFALNSFNNPSINRQSIVKIAKFSISSKINLIPCKLLQSIPAILDGNGIARQAGTCGMWDKVNDKFYGNVASSGSFTVSN